MTATSGPTAREERFESLFRANRADILSYFLRRVVSKPDAADLLAETFLVAWRKLDEVPFGEAGRLWLFGVSRRVLGNHHRHERTEEVLVEHLRQQVGLQADIHMTHRTVPFDDIIASALDRLHTADREIIELSAWERLSPSQIARVIDMKPGAVRVRLHRLRRTLAAQLIRAGYPTTAQAERIR
jgi:RNA polymerase sigma factor (sigma-70 family)